MLYVVLWRGPYHKKLLFLANSQQGPEACWVGSGSPAFSQQLWVGLEQTFAKLSMCVTKAVATTLLLALWDSLSQRYPAKLTYRYCNLWVFILSCYVLVVIYYRTTERGASLVAQTVKNLPAMWETWDWLLGWELIPWRRAWQPTPVFLPGESHGQRSLAGCSPWGHKRVGHDEQLSIAQP